MTPFFCRHFILMSNIDPPFLALGGHCRILTPFFSLRHGCRILRSQSPAEPTRPWWTRVPPPPPPPPPGTECVSSAIDILLLLFWSNNARDRKRFSVSLGLCEEIHNFPGFPTQRVMRNYGFSLMSFSTNRSILPINDCARKRPLAEGWSLGPARWEPRLKRHSIDFRNSIKSIIIHKLNHASARNMYQNINFMNSNWSLIHHNVHKLYIQSKTYPVHFRMFTEYPQNFLKGCQCHRRDNE